MVREFSREPHRPGGAASSTAPPTFPWDNIKAMGELGLLGVPWSEELGGAGHGPALLLHHHPRDGQGGREPRAHHQRPHQPRHLADRRVRHRGAAASATCRCSRRAGCWAASGSPSRAPGATPAAPPPPRSTRAITTCSTAPRSSSPTPAWARSSSVTARTEPGSGNKGITSFIVTKDTVDLDQCRDARRRPRGRPAQDSRASGPARRRTRWAGAPATRAS